MLGVAKPKQMPSGSTPTAFLHSSILCLCIVWELQAETFLLCGGFDSLGGSPNMVEIMKVDFNPVLSGCGEFLSGDRMTSITCTCLSGAGVGLQEWEVFQRLGHGTLGPNTFLHI